MKRSTLAALSASIVAIGMSSQIRAATIDWANVGADYITGTNWVGGAAPTNDLTTDIARFVAGATVQPTYSGTANRQVNGFIFDDGYTFTQTAGGGFQIGASGLSFNSGASTMNINLTAGTSVSHLQTWSVASGASVVFSRAAAATYANNYLISGTVSYSPSSATTSGFATNTGVTAATLTVNGILNANSLTTLNIGTASTALTGTVGAAGQLNIASGAAVNFSGNGIATSSLTLNGSLTHAGTLGVSGLTINNNTGSGLSLPSVIAFNGATAWTSNSANLATISGSSANTGTGAITLSGGLLQLNKSGGVAALGSGTGKQIVIASSGTTVRWLADNQLNGTGGTASAQFTVPTGSVVDLNGFNDSFAFSGNEKITLSGGTVQTGAGTWTFTGNNASPAVVNGTTVSTISGKVNFGGATTDRSVTVTNNAVGLDLNWSADITLGDQFTISGSVANSGAEVSLGGNNNFGLNATAGGDLTLSNGVTVYLDHANALGAPAQTGANSVAAGSTLALRGGINYAETANTLIQFNATPGLRSVSGNNTWNGALTNPGGTGLVPAHIQVDADTLNMAGSLAAFISSNGRSLAKTGTGSLLYTNAAATTATVYVNDGAVIFGFATAVNGRGGNTTPNGGVFGSIENIAQALGSGSNQTRFGPNGGGYTAHNADITVDHIGITTLVWGGGATSQTVATTITGGAVTAIGSIYFGGAGYTGTEAVTFTAAPSGGTTATGTITVVNGVVTGVNIVNPGSGYTATPTATIAAPVRDGGTANYLANGAPLILNSTTATAKVTLLDNIDLAASTATFTGNREIRVLNNAASTADRGVIQGVISSSKSGIGINKTGAGTLELPAGVTHTYSGSTNVNAGRLVVNGILSSGGGTVTVNTGATLGGSGIVNRAVNVAGGTLSPGESPGILTLDSLTLDAGTYSVEIFGPTPGNGASNHDQTVVTAGVTLLNSPTLALDFGSYAFSSSDKYFIVVQGGSSPVSGAFAGFTPAGASAVPFVFAGGQGLLSYVGDSSTGSVTGGNDIVIYNVTIPEPTTLTALAGFAALTLIRRRSR